MKVTGLTIVQGNPIRENGERFQHFYSVDASLVGTVDAEIGFTYGLGAPLVWLGYLNCSVSPLNS